jgi:hypothetical protein
LQYVNVIPLLAWASFSKNQIMSVIIEIPALTFMIASYIVNHEGANGSPSQFTRSAKMARKIVTSYENPPIPVPAFWVAWDDNLGADTSPIGQGATEAEAIECLVEMLDFFEGL